MGTESTTSIFFEDLGMTDVASMTLTVAAAFMVVAAAMGCLAGNSQNACLAFCVSFFQISCQI